jgi:2-dehydro-3-deoxyglucarate aldolase
MNRFSQITKIRDKLSSGLYSIGSWIQIPDASIAEIMGKSGYDWVAVDLEHGSISASQLPNIFRAIELGASLPIARIAQGSVKDCKQALDAGAGGIIIPMIESANQLSNVISACRFPPSGTRGVGFSRANIFGKYFESYSAAEAQNPLIIAMIEHINAVNDLEKILNVEGLDAIFIGPYDLSASMGITGKFDELIFIRTIEKIKTFCTERGIACGMHIVKPDVDLLKRRVAEGYQFIAYSMDSVFLATAAENPKLR